MMFDPMLPSLWKFRIFRGWWGLKELDGRVMDTENA